MSHSNLEGVTFHGRVSVGPAVENAGVQVQPTIKASTQLLGIEALSNNASKAPPPSLILKSARQIANFALIGPANLAIGLTAVVCTIVRFVATIALLPIIYVGHLISTSLGPKAQHSAKVTTEVANDRFSANKSPVRTKKEVKKALLNDPSKTIELAKDKARKSYKNRLEYFSHFNKNVGDIFSVDAYKKNYPGKELDLQKLKLSFDSYLNLTLVYRFDGEDMVGRNINLIHFKKDNDGNVSTEIVEYRVEKYFQDTDGLVGYGLKPTNPDSEAPPRLIFRGTNTKPFKNEAGDSVKLPTGLTADSARNIGKKTYTKKKSEISEWLEGVTDKGAKKAVVSGHSLGGAISQRVAADNPKFVGEVFTQNSPRIEQEGLKPKNEKDFDHMKITHIVMGGDKVPKIGGGRASAGSLLTNGKGEDEVLSIEAQGHTSKILNNYCMSGDDFACREHSVEVQMRRDLFWAKILDFIRPHVHLYRFHES